MRRRLTIALLGTVLVSLLLAGIVTLSLVRRADRQATQRALEQEATVLAELMETNPFDLRHPNPRLLLAAETLRRNDVTVLLLRDRAVLGEFPDQVLPEDLHPLAAGSERQVSGIRGSTAWAAAVGERPGRLPTAVVLTDDADQLLGTVVRWSVVSAAISLGLAAVVAAVLSRRLTRPLSQARDATLTIADGDLSARVPIQAGRRDEIGDLSSSINDMAASLERSHNVERQFLMSISHDLRTPLTSIRGYSEAIVDGTAADEPQAAEIIVSEAARLERLVNDLLDLARLDAREFTLDLRLVDVGTVIEEVCAGFAQVAADRQLELRALMPAETGRVAPVMAWCDPGRLAQIIANLVQNALRFADTIVQVECRMEDSSDDPAVGARTIITVADDGPGISEQDRPHVFERLYVARHTPQAKEAGSGLGLAIVAELAEAMNGAVSVAGRHPVGTQFTVELPGTEPEESSG
ncbi:sensor histidine kinase [Candidatus Poriferisocius sp.]|uniref:sensor histidine kinase n=1 Tax=Candidatus Poriferisocius sp. TaxID=3101276 RepID=UPI003B5AB279